MLIGLGYSDIFFFLFSLFGRQSFDPKINQDHRIGTIVVK